MSDINKKPSGAILVGGIDTGVGKTVACGLMARYLLQKGVNVITVKLVQTGNVGFSEDLELHRAIMGKNFPEDAMGLTAPQIFSFPASPLLAGRLEGKTVDVEKISQSIKELQNRYDVVLIEAAGGLAVPLTRNLLTIDFAASLDWRLILVTSGKLGSVNHTVLSLESALGRGIDVLGAAYNYCPDADPVIDGDSASYILEFMQKKGIRPTLSRVPKVDLSRLPNGLPAVDFSPIFVDYLKGNRY